MFTIEGICDWCKQRGLLEKHVYVDGKCHYSCKNCHQYALIDVRQFNLDELAARQKSAFQQH